MAFLPEKVITVEGSLPPEAPTIARVDEAEVATLQVGFPESYTLSLKASNVKILQLDLYKLLEGYGLTKGQIATYMNSLVQNATKYVVKADFDVPEAFLVLNLPKNCKVKNVTVDGKIPTAEVEGKTVNLWLWDAREGVLLTPVFSESPAEITIYLQPTIQEAVSTATQTAIAIIITPVLVSAIKAAIRHFKKT